MIKAKGKKLAKNMIKAKGNKLVVLFVGRDAAGKGGAIKCVADPLNPRSCRIVVSMSGSGIPLAAGS
jgi:polyphosphate kinase 2 (PPK2 family)